MHAVQWPVFNPTPRKQLFVKDSDTAVRYSFLPEARHHSAVLSGNTKHIANGSHMFTDIKVKTRRPPKVE